MTFYKIYVPYNPEKMSLVTLEVDAPIVGCMLGGWDLGKIGDKWVMTSSDAGR